MVSFRDFQKLNLRVAEIIEAERVENSDRLLKLKINLGSEERNIVAGIGEFYPPEELIGREIIVVADLEPRKIMGSLSQGMLLAADVEGRPVLLRPDKNVPPGSEVR